MKKEQLSKSEMQMRERLWERGKKIVIEAPQLFLDVDVEADGIAGYGSMLSIGAVSPFGDTFYSEIKPIFDSFIPGNRDFCEGHDLQRERLLREAPDFVEVMHGFAEFIETLKQRTGKQPVFTAFNAAYDWALVDLYFLMSDVRPNPFGIAPFDLKPLGIPLSRNWDFKETSKSRLPKIIIPDGDFTHHALEDAVYQQKIHFGLAGILGKRNYKKFWMP